MFDGAVCGLSGEKVFARLADFFYRVIKNWGQVGPFESFY